MSQAECEICRMIERVPPDGAVYDAKNWVAGVFGGFEVPGWLVLALRRHAEGAAPLEPEEAADLGPAIRTVSSALAEATGAERVYVQGYAEAHPHWHMLLSARGTEVPVEHRAANFVLHREQYIDLEEAPRVAARVREILNPEKEQ